MTLTRSDHSYRLTLPVAVGVNRMWKPNANGGVRLSDEAKDYKLAAGLLALHQGARCFEGAVAVHVDVYRPAKRGDLDGYLKVLIDALIGICFRDDKQVVEIHARRFDDKLNPRMEVTIEEVVA